MPTDADIQEAVDSFGDEVAGQLRGRLSELQEQADVFGPSKSNPIGNRINAWLRASFNDAAAGLDAIGMDEEGWDFLPGTGVATLAEAVTVGDTVITIEDTSSNDSEWSSDEGHNRIGFVTDDNVRISSILPEFTSVTKSVSTDRVSVRLDRGVTRRWIKEFYTQQGLEPSSPLTIPAGSRIANFHKGIDGLAGIESAGLDAMGRVVDEAVDMLEEAVADMDSRPVVFVCCLIRQLAAWNVAEDKSIRASADLSEQAREGFRRGRTMLTYLRLILSITANQVGTVNFKIGSFNIFRIMMDSVLIAMTGTLQLLFNILRNRITAWAMEMLRNNKILSCIPLYSLIQMSLSRLFGRDGLLPQLISFMKNSNARMHNFLRVDVQEQIRSNIGIRNLNVVIQLVDAIIAATWQSELCQQSVPETYDITKQETGDEGLTGDKEEDIKSPNFDPGEFATNPIRDGFEEYNSLDSALDGLMGRSSAVGVSTAIGEPDLSGSATTADVGTAIDVADILVREPTDEELERFMTTRLGVDAAVARDAVYRSRIDGKCAQGLGSTELQEVLDALETAGVL